MRKIYFTSDLHFQDERLNLYSRDLVFRNSKEVDDHIIKIWNEKINKEDLVILVGDISMTREGLHYLSELNGEKWLVKGNYDNSIENGGTAKYEISDEILSEYFTKVVDDLELEIGGETVYINHYPTNARSSMFNIVGHIHGTWKVQRNMVNVGTDAWHFNPVSEDMIKFQMNGIRKFYDQNVYAGELKADTKNIRGEVRVLRAPKYDITFDNENDIAIFLAGPIQGAPNWHDEFIQKLKDKLKNALLNRNVLICSPKRIEVDHTNFEYNEQVDWESFYLNKASKNGVVVFWLANEKEKVTGRCYAQTTRFEIGEWWAKGQSIKDFNIVVGSEENFDGLKYISKKFTDSYTGFRMNTNIDDMVDDIVEKLKL